MLQPDVQLTNSLKMQLNAEFHESTDTFNLAVVLAEGRLNITLNDFMDWVIYSKGYTEADIGREIDRRMDLSDIFTALSQNITNNSSLEINKQNLGRSRVGELKHYQFGSVVEHEGNPCYRIQKGGKLTVYLGIIDKKTKKQITYASNLTLVKLRNMTETEILSVKAENEKKRVFDEQNQKIQRQEKQKQFLLARIIHLEEQNTTLKQQLRMAKQAQNQKNQRFQQKITQTNQQLSIQTQRTLDRLSKLQKMYSALNTSLICIPLPQAYSSYFKLHGLHLQYTSTNNTHTQYIFNHPILPSQHSTFTLKITQTQHKCMVIGVVDYSREKNQRCVYYVNSDSYVGYYGSNGFLCPQKVREGEGFKQGDVLEVDVNRATNTVKYSVNGILTATHVNNMLGNGQRVFMPFVEMYNTNDAVEWLMR